MKAITIIQPWATLLATGTKQFETRSWNTNQRGLFAIHASKRTKVSDAAFSALYDEIHEVFDHLHLSSPNDLAYGAVVGAARLVACHSTDELWKNVTETELNLGDWSPNRFAWDFREAYLLPTALPYRGQQGIWEFPDALLYKAVQP